MNGKKAKAIRKKVLEQCKGNPKKFKWAYRKMKKMYNQGRFEI